MYYLKKDRFGNHVLNKEGERLFMKLIVKPPRQHGRRKLKIEGERRGAKGERGIEE